ncbi:translation initiation factor IF-2 [Mycoplasmatota bacterium]|nr:translation initiation factor IF-2 [Mycoplasmatota bacterium]
MSVNKKKKQKEDRISNAPKKVNDSETVLYFKDDMTLIEVADSTKIAVTELIKKLMMLGVMANQNQVVDRETLEVVLEDFNIEIKDEVVTDILRFDEFTIEDEEEDLVERPPVVTIMGHVDHGKTTLLDAIRSSRVVTGEFGGITQHIGAYQVEKNGKKISFLDTPGHAAFTEMRARGAQVTDIVIIVVAADDGVMPQTREAIDHAKAANVPIIVAVNKIDKPGVNPDRVKQELTEYNLIPEEWGGDTIFCNISALKGDGVENLLEVIQLVAEVESFTANPNRLALGTVVEAKLDKSTGPVATLLVQNGTMRIRDSIVVGNTYGKVRMMRDDLGNNIDEAGPSMPCEIAGLNEVPQAGDKFMILKDDKVARQTAEERAHAAWKNDKTASKAVSLEDLFANLQGGDTKDINIIIKADVQGSVEALKGSLANIDVEGVDVNIVRASVGTITETDITLALASNAIVIGFNVRPTAKVRNLAAESGVDIRLHNIIYKVIEELESAMTGLLDPVYVEKITGQVEVRDIFKASKIGTIAGSYVTDGVIYRNSMIRLIRDGIVIYEGELSSLKRFKDDAKEVNRGYECGITIANYNDIKVGDIIECYIMAEEK